MADWMNPANPAVTEGLANRFYAKVVKGEGCWDWLGWKDARGYGYIWADGRMFGAYRVSLLLTRGPSEGKIALHSCDNPSCVNPDHLRWGTYKENTADKINRKRANTPRGTNNYIAKLNDEIVRLIRGSSLTNRELAKMYGVWPGTIQAVRNRKNWSHV